MKLVADNSSLSPKNISKPKPFKYHENANDSDVLKKQKGNVRRDKLSCPITDIDKRAPCKLDISLNVSDHEKLSYLDKSVTKRERPELIVCDKENSCNVVKDICVDKGVVSRDIEESIKDRDEGMDSASEKQNNGSENNRNSVGFGVTSSTEELKVKEEVVYESKMETSSSSSIVFDMDPQTVESNIDKVDVQNHVVVSSQLRNCMGEMSFSAVSGRITYSGPIAYSGSLSIRSDSSTTSTRSFAFPVIQSEWNTSPVRMAKAERGNVGKHKGWRQGILCCRF